MLGICNASASSRFAIFFLAFQPQLCGQLVVFLRVDWLWVFQRIFDVWDYRDMLVVVRLLTGSFPA